MELSEPFKKNLKKWLELGSNDQGHYCPFKRQCIFCYKLLKNFDKKRKREAKKLPQYGENVD